MNHSLHATGATTLFDAGIPEAVKPDKSLEALRTYKCVIPAQEQVVASVLAPVAPVTTPVTLVTSSELPVTSTCTSSPTAARVKLLPHYHAVLSRQMQTRALA